MTDTKSPNGTSDLIEVRATVNLTGLRAGQVALVDPSSPYIRALLDTQRLVSLNGD